MRTAPPILLLLLSLTASASIYSVQVDTSALPSAGTFSFDFQFFDGSGLPLDLNNNSVAISSLSLGGGTLIGVPSLTGGGAGNAVTGFTIDDSDFFNEALQSFHPGSQLSFQLSVTTNVDPGGTPDLLSFAILDSTLVELPTNGFADELFSITLDGQPPTVAAFSTALSSPYAIPSPSLIEQTTVPEPATGALAFSVLVCMVAAGVLGNSRRRYPGGSQGGRS